jgi:hypothetical protein
MGILSASLDGVKISPPSPDSLNHEIRNSGVWTCQVRDLSGILQSDKMRLSPAQQIQEERREGAWLRALEAGHTTVPDLVRDTGLSRSQVYFRLARAKENRPIEEASHAPAEGLDPLDYPQMVLTTVPEVESGHWVHLHTGSCSADRGCFNVGGRVKDVTTGRIVKAEDAEEAEVEPPPTPSFRPHARKRRPKLLTPEELEKLKAKGSRKKCAS